MNAIAVDAMGGDHAPGPEIVGALAAVREAGLRVLLCGDRERLAAELATAGATAAERERIELRHATEVVTMDDHPGKVFRQKRGSSMRMAFDLVAAGEASAVVSAGNSGAMLSHAVFVLKRLEDVERPGIVTVFPRPHSERELEELARRGPRRGPTPTGTLVLCDMGANVEVKPTMLAQFGILGAHYDRIVHGHERPRVGLLSNGSEDSKGTELTRAAHAILGQAARNPEAQFDYVGYVEGNDLFRGDIDVVATDGFTGNVVLKVSEGVSQVVMRMVKSALTSSARAKLGAALARPALLELRQRISYSEAGGAVLAGVDGVVIICHGKSEPAAIKNAIKAADRFAGAGLTEQLGLAMKRHHGLWALAEAQGERRAASAGGDPIP
jgi:glycerol-3-phosphate acyltransferase PlsX